MVFIDTLVFLTDLKPTKSYCFHRAKYIYEFRGMNNDFQG